MSITAAPPMMPPGAPAEGAPPDQNAEAEQAITLIGAVAEQVQEAAIKDRGYLERLVSELVKYPELVSMLHGKGDEAEDMGEEDTFEQDLELLSSETDDVGEISDEDLMAFAE
jgi:hypothetical protein